MAGTLGAITSIPAGSTATTTTPVALDNVTSMTFHTMMCIPAGTIAGGVITLNLSLDGANWFTPAGTSTITLATGVTAGLNIQCVARFARASITTTVSGAGGSVTVLVASGG